MKKALLLAVVVVWSMGCGRDVANPGFCVDDGDCTVARGFAPEQTKCAGETNDLATRWRCVASLGGDAGPDTLPIVDVLPGETRADGNTVVCTTNAQCTDSLRPTCGPTGVCQPCNTNSCQGALPFCSPSGACVACLKSMDCPSTTPICSSANACVACNAATAATDGCAKRDLAHAVCVPTGSPKAGQCVGCVDNTACTSTTKPICDDKGDKSTNECRGCAADTECKAGPGVCMDHQDGRCATDEETIYVRKPSGCVGGVGSAASPLCSAQDVPPLLAPSRRLIVLRGSIDRFAWTLSGAQVSVIAKNDATISPGGDVGMQVSGGDFYGRGFTVSGGIPCEPIGSCPAIRAAGGAKFALKNVVVSDNKGGGGILLDGASFDIRNTTVTGNGPGVVAGDVAWGGIRAQNIPSNGPANLEQVTITNNKQVGLSCSSPIMGVGVLATANAGGLEVAPSCQVTPCTPGALNCGAP